MVEFSAKRRRIIMSFGSSLLFVMLSSCFPPKVITIKNITTAVETVALLLKVSRQISNDTVYSMNVSFEELSGFLREQNFSTDTIQRMEQRTISLSENASKLRSQLRQTNSEAEQLFSLLETRAKQNSTSNLKKQMLSDIRDKKKVFKAKMAIANEVLSKVEKSVQKYDDILGYIQVGTGINQIDQYIHDVDTVILQANALDTEIKNALNESYKIIATFEN